MLNGRLPEKLVWLVRASMCWLFCVAVVLGWTQASIVVANQQEQQPPFDVVEYQKDSVSPRKVLAGYVVDLTDRQLKIDLGTNGQRTIDIEQVLAVRLNSVSEVVQARQLALAGKFTAAIDKWAEVIEQQESVWLQRHAAAQRCYCQDAAGQKLAAVTSFMALARNSPKNVPWQVAPLVWANGPNHRIIDQQLESWLKAKDPIQLFLAASLGLQSTKYRNTCQKILQQASAAKDEKLASMAKTQLWRLEAQVSDNRLKEMESQLAAMPSELRAGGLFVLGRLKKNAGQAKAATADFLRVATLYPEHHTLVLLGLDQAYLTLSGMDDPQAETIARWLKQRFPESAAAMAIELPSQ